MRITELQLICPCCNHQMKISGMNVQRNVTNKNVLLQLEDKPIMFIDQIENIDATQADHLIITVPFEFEAQKK